MRDTQTLLTALAVAILFAVLVYLFLKYRPRKAEAERRRVSRALRSFAKPRGFRVLDRATLVHDGRSGWADHIVVGYFGVLLVYDLYMPGEYYGAPNDETWRVFADGKWYAMTNPVPPSIQCEGRVRTLCKDNGMKVDVERVVVVTGDRKKTLIQGLKCPGVVKLSDLRGEVLSKERFDQDRGVDIEKVAALLESARAKDEEKDGKAS